MAASTGPNLGIKYGWALRESGWNTDMDANLKKVDALMALAVADRDLTAPPGSPSNGDRYIVAAGATGAWAGKDGQLAVRLAGAWTYHVPTAGTLAWIVDEGKLAVYTGAAWSAGAAI